MAEVYDYLYLLQILQKYLVASNFIVQLYGSRNGKSFLRNSDPSRVR